MRNVRQCTVTIPNTIQGAEMDYAYIPSTIDGKCVSCSCPTHGMAIKDGEKKYLCCDCLISKVDPFALKLKKIITSEGAKSNPVRLGVSWIE